MGMDTATAETHAQRYTTTPDRGADLYAEPIRMKVYFCQMMVPIIGRIKERAREWVQREKRVKMTGHTRNEV